MGVPPVYNAGDINAGIKPIIQYTTTVKPMNPNLAVNGADIFLARTDNFDIKCIYPAEFEIETGYTTLTDKIGITGSKTNRDARMIGDFLLQSFADDAFTTPITPDAPVELGNMIYNKLSVANLPTGFDYIVDNCVVDNIANKNWETDGQFLKLFEKQTCKNDLKETLAIIIRDKLPQSMDYGFDFISFSFAANNDGKNPQSLTCKINICGTIGGDNIACPAKPAQASDCPPGFTL